MKDRKKADRLAWLASRQPPFRKRVRHNPDGSLLEDPLRIDLTEVLSKARHVSQRIKDGLEVLYDCRFLIRFDIAKMPSEIGIAVCGSIESGRRSEDEMVAPAHLLAKTRER